MMKLNFSKIIVIVCIVLSRVMFGAEEVIVVGVQDFENYMPYSQYKNGKFAGFERELLDLFAKKAGIKFEYKALPIKRGYNDLLNGKIDIKIPDNPYWSLDKKKDMI